MNKFMSGLLASVFVFITPVIPLIYLVLSFILMDTFVGVLCAKHLGKPIKSRTLSRVISKITIYVFTLLLIFGLDVLVLSTWIETHMLVTKVGAGILCFIEGFSIDENIRKCNKDKGVGYYFGKVFEVVKKAKEKYNEIINGNDKNVEK